MSAPSCPTATGSDSALLAGVATTNAWDVLSSMAGLHGLDAGRAGVHLLLAIAALVAFVNLAPNTWEVRLRWRPAYGLLLGFAAATAILMLSTATPFLYFRF